VSESTRRGGGDSPAPVRIDDFADPQFSPEVREMLAGIEPLGEQVELTPASLMDQARAETGLSDFGPDDFIERLDVYCTALREEAGLSNVGRFNNQQQLVKVAEEPAARRGPRGPPPGGARRRDPRAHRHLRPPAHRHHAPAQPDVGRPGSAVTRVLESLEPVLAPAEQPAVGAPDPRLARTEIGLQFMHAAMAVLQPHARDDRRSRARGDPAPHDRRLDDADGDERVHAELGRVLQGP
jgi:hypothetical protein